MTVLKRRFAAVGVRDSKSPAGEFVAFLDGLLFGQIVGAKPTT